MAAKEASAFPPAPPTTATRSGSKRRPTTAAAWRRFRSDGASRSTREASSDCTLSGKAAATARGSKSRPAALRRTIPRSTTKLAISSAKSALPSALATISFASASGKWSTPSRASAIRAVSRADKGSIGNRVTCGWPAQGGAYSGRRVCRIRSWRGSSMATIFASRSSEALSTQ